MFAGKMLLCIGGCVLCIVLCTVVGGTLFIWSSDGSWWKMDSCLPTPFFELTTLTDGNLELIDSIIAQARCEILQTLIDAKCPFYHSIRSSTKSCHQTWKWPFLLKWTIPISQFWFTNHYPISSGVFVLLTSTEEMKLKESFLKLFYHFILPIFEGLYFRPLAHCISLLIDMVNALLLILPYKKYLIAIIWFRKWLSYILNWETALGKSCF